MSSAIKQAALTIKKESKDVLCINYVHLIGRVIIRQTLLTNFIEYLHFML